LKPSAHAGVAAEEIYERVRTRLKPRFQDFLALSSTAELEAHPKYREIRDDVRFVLDTPEQGDYSTAPAEEKDAYRVFAWNIERGVYFDEQLEVLRSHPYASSADLLLLTETDVGMARSGNHAVAQEFAQALNMHYAFAPCYINLVKGSGIEYDMEGENDVALHGNAILSRYPLSNVRPVALKNGKDKMRGREKRLGRQAAVLADVELPQGLVTLASVHLDANSTQRHRHDQMRDVLDAIDPEMPTIVGGDWNTSTFDTSSPTPAILGFWRRVFMGADNVIRNHYLRPYTKFESELFELLENRGLDWRNSNALDVRTTSYDVEDVKADKILKEWLPEWCFQFIRWSLRNHGGKCPLKIDWCAVRGLQPENPLVMHEFREGRKPPLSDHDALGLDVRFS